MNVKIYNQEGLEVGAVELSSEVFGIEPNEAVVHQYIVNFLARQRQGNSSTKERSAVRGGGRKPWRQKGTGRARAGTIRSPLWRGGGIVFGPHPRSYGSDMPKKMRRLAIKAGVERIKVLDQIKLEQIKTKVMVGIIDKLELTGKKCLILDEGRNDNLVKSCQNMPRVKYCRASLANGYDLLNADYLILTKAGLEKVQEVFG